MTLLITQSLQKEDSDSGEDFSKDVAEVERGSDEEDDDEEPAPKKKVAKKPAKPVSKKKAAKKVCSYAFN